MLKRISALAVLCALFSYTIASATPTSPFIVGGLRPVTVNLPADTSQPSPLLIALHSASTNGAHLEKNMKLIPIAKKLGMISIFPDGTVGKDGRRVWNAAKACCQKPGVEVDDIAYINSLIDEIDAKYPVDRKRIYFVGQSNGAFMSLTFACATGKVAGVISLAGAMDLEGACATTTPFAFLHIHGAADATIKINGGVLNFHAYTSATETVSRIAAVNRCVTPKFSQANFIKKDFDPTIPGMETTVQNLTNCKAPVSYWRIARGPHSPKLPQNFADQALSFLAKQIKS